MVHEYALFCYEYIWKKVHCDTWCASTAFGGKIENLLPAGITKVKKQTREKDKVHRNRKQQAKGREPSH